MSIHSKLISDNPQDRIPSEMKAALERSDLFIDVHAHVFNYEDVPDGFLGIRLPFNQRFLYLTERVLHRIIGSSDRDFFSSLAYFVQFFRKRSSIETAEKLTGYHKDVHLLFCALMMDMERGIKGKIIDPYSQQIEKMKAVRDKFPEAVLPFFAADPNNPALHEDFERSFSTAGDYRFFGVKIYPSLGYLPSNPRLMDIFRVCGEKKIPVTAHCSGATVHASARTFRNIEGWHYTEGEGFSNRPVNLNIKKRSDYAVFFNHPRNWEPVLDAIPGLKLNLAHFGGEGEWAKHIQGNKDTWVSYILSLLENYPNLYTDFSYTLHNGQYNEVLKTMLEQHELLSGRVLYGSDYYMVVREGHFRSLKAGFISLMGADLMKKIAQENPKRFLLG
jgi:predicted TIM-barrel fold metal-dependent hydrolase